MSENVSVTKPVRKFVLKTNRGFWKLFFLSLITFGIYSIVFYTSLGNDVNIIASRNDGKRTMNYCLLFFLLMPITCGIAAIVWFHKISNRIGGELVRKGINYRFSAGTFWLWNLLGALILVGPFIYIAKLCKAMNFICLSYNTEG